MEEHIQNQQGIQQWQHDKSHDKLRKLSPCDLVNVQNTQGGIEMWVPSTVIRRLGPLTYLVRVGHQLCYVHINHLLQTECVNCGEAFEEVVPEESSAPLSGLSTPPTVSGSSTPPPPSVGVSMTTQDQPTETQKPTAEPILQSSTRDSLAAQEPVSMSPEQIPVAVPELELPSLVQHPSETSPRNMPIRAERRYLARERKAPEA